MQRYNSTGNTGVIAYEMGEASIMIRFQDGTVYLYTNASAGHENVEQMRRLAIAGKGLTTFINQVVKNRYEEKS